MKNLNEIPGFLPEDYDKEPPGIEDENFDLKEPQKKWLHHDQKAKEDGIALGEQMSAEYDSYLVIGFKTEQRDDTGCVTEHELVSGACHVDSGDYDAVYEMARLLGYYAFKNFEVYKILKKALSRCKSFHDEEDNPEPPVHDYLPRDERFHQNRYDRILSEEFEKVQDKFRKALGDYALRREMQMKMVLTAIADQLNGNEDVEVDFFCNFVLNTESDGDDVSGINIWLRPYPCSWEEADANCRRFIELCKQYNIPCHIEWPHD